VVKYIPELQEQVMGLILKKEELLSRISGQEYHHVTRQEKQPKSIAWSSLSSVSASQLDDREAVIQISTRTVHKNALSEILVNLEEDGLVLLNASSFESFEGRVFCNLHLQVSFSNLSVPFAFSILAQHSYSSKQ